MEEQEFLNFTLPGYTLGSRFCCVFLFVKTHVLAKLIFQITVKDLDICPIEPETKPSKVAILSDYRRFYPFGTGVLHLNFSTPCMQNLNNTGTKKGSIMK
jgi:hypothetical protein